MTEKNHRGQVRNGHVCMPPTQKTKKGRSATTARADTIEQVHFFRRNRVTGAFDLEYADAITA
jgi:hypothetical protein